MKAGIACLSIACCLAASSLSADPIRRGAPTPEQMAWHELELAMFVHFAPATWQNREYDNHSTPLSDISPSKLNTDQWCEVAESFGARQIVFVAKHVGDFCWWQTDTTDYGIKETPYQDGEGDVLAELSQSCNKYGLKLGVYIYPGNHKLGAGIGSGGRTKNPADQKQADRIYRQQLAEVLSRYGAISEIWFDGSCKTPVQDIIDRYAPEAMVFQGPQATIRWPGNEHGHSPYPAWQTVTQKDAASGVATGRHSDPDGDVWLPMEMDTTLLNKAWFYKQNWDHRVKTVDQLMDIYLKSVGRGGILMLNATPDTTGLIPEFHVQRYQEFGAAIRRVYKNKKGETCGSGSEFTIMFKEPTIVSHTITMENIQHGHVIRAYEIEGLVAGAWRSLHKGASIGYKQIDLIEPVELGGIRLRAIESVDTPQVKSFAAYEMGDEYDVSKDEAQGEWQKVSELLLTNTWQTMDVDLTKQIRDTGQYEVEIRPTGEIELKDVLVLLAEAEAPRLITKLDRPNAWNINRTAAVTSGPRGRTSLRLVAKSAGSGTQESWVYLRKMQ